MADSPHAHTGICDGTEGLQKSRGQNRGEKKQTLLSRGEKKTDNPERPRKKNTQGAEETRQTWWGQSVKESKICGGRPCEW